MFHITMHPDLLRHKPALSAAIMEQTFPDPMQIQGWQKIPFSNLQGELSKEN